MTTPIAELHDTNDGDGGGGGGGDGSDIVASQLSPVGVVGGPGSLQHVTNILPMDRQIEVSLKPDESTNENHHHHHHHSPMHLVGRLVPHPGDASTTTTTTVDSITTTTTTGHFVRPIIQHDDGLRSVIDARHHHQHHHPHHHHQLTTSVIENYSVRSLMDPGAVQPVISVDDNSISSSLEDHSVSSIIEERMEENSASTIHATIRSDSFVESVENLVQSLPIESQPSLAHQSSSPKIQSFNQQPIHHTSEGDAMSNIKQEQEEINCQANEFNEVSPRKSLRLSKRISQITEMQVDIDPNSIQQEQSYSNETQSLIEDIDEDDDEEEEEEEGDEEEDEGNKSVDQDFVVNEEEIENEDEEEGDSFDEDDELDEFRPLKKRRLSRKGKKCSKLTKPSTEVQKLHQVIYKLRQHELVVKRFLDTLVKMNTSLIDKMFNLISGEVSANISVHRLLEMLRSLQAAKNIADDSFLGEFASLYEQYKKISVEKVNLEQSIDTEEIDEKEIEDCVGKYLKRKRKICLLELISETRPGKRTRGRPRKLDTCATNTVGTNGGGGGATVATFKPRRKRRKVKDGTADEEEKSSYHPCPWPNCTYESKREWALNEHINLTHTGLKQFGCKVDGCPSTFFGSAELDNHMKKFHAEEASKEFMPCTWPGCNALFKSKLGLRAHVQVHKGENLIACDWPGCNYNAKNKRQHENHIRKHTGDRPFACDYPGCDSKFRTNDSLRHHKKSHSEYRPFKCDWPGCDANFKTNRGLTIHRALHTGEKLFKCDWPDCDFASERKYHVDLHVYERHTHVKPYQCSWAGCEASFLRNDKLQNHLKIHRQEKPFKCIHPACDKHFVEKGNMMKHYNNVHKR